MTKSKFTSAALAELKQATLNYEEKENGLGQIFLDEIDATIARILSNPHAWHPLSPNKALPHTPLPLRTNLPDSFR
jgi:hypothetical protein